MQREYFTKTLYTSFLFLILWFCFSSTAYAQQAGVSITPALIEETLKPGDVKEYAISITNLNSTEQKFYISKRNISDVKEGGAPVFDRPGAEDTGMGIADWLSFSVSEITLASNSSAEFKAMLTVPSDATPCGRFGSIFVTVDPPEIQNSGAAVGYQVANILSIQVAGDCNDSAMIRQFSTDNYFNGSQNIDFSLRIENSGNLLVRPTGPLEVYNMLGKKVDTITFNETQNAVFPGKVREYEFNWTGEGIGFGRYEALISAVYGNSGEKKTMSSSVTFWILPLNIIGPALAFLALILLISFISVKLYIKRTLAHLSSGTRIIRSKKNRGSSATLLLLVVMLSVTALFLIVLLVLFA